MKGKSVSLCVREWIETFVTMLISAGTFVSLCVREWIETKKEARLLY